ncbi:hypothetical protein [Candidatus Nanohalovita haloferacivicina]|uniref:hypothetical protein n=1 Tax=Candidatus Nanohalovita haloferacivicina TaxID=2978046 RepID=UPI00325FDE25|nr:hypothetical protein HBNXNv_0839 [Candidatus Nanohalobia archaeon BNXNv]
MGQNSTFGYGSLILPTSVLARFDDDIGPAKPIYDEGKELGDEGLLREEAVEAWEEEKDREEGLEFVPVKIPGFRRNYTLEKYGGTMLEAEHTGDDEDVINGVVIRGLDDEQYDAIASSEGYGVEEVDPDVIQPYVDGVDLDTSVTIFTESVDDRSDYFTSRGRQETYHSRILKGIEMMADMHGEDVAEEFRDDFLDNTYENAVPGNSFPKDTPEEDRRDLRRELMNTVRQKDRSIQGFNNLMDSIEDDYRKARKQGL